MLTFDQFETLRTIVRCGTFSRAAEELYLTQPAVSQRVKHLESTLGTEVFRRGNNVRGVHLTPAGERVLAFANEVLGALDSLRNDLRPRNEEGRQTLTLACGPFIARYILPRILTAYRETFGHPLLVRHQQVAVDDLNGVVRRGEADFAVNTRAFIEPDLVSVPLFRDRVVLVAHPSHPFLQDDPSCPASIARQQFVLSPSNSEPRRIADAWAAAMGVQLDIVMEASSYDALKEAALQGLGLAVVPETIVSEEVEDGRLRVIEMSGLPCERVICLVHDPNRPPGPAAASLLRLVETGRWQEQLPVHNPC